MANNYAEVLWDRAEEFVSKQLPYAFITKDGSPPRLNKEEWNDSSAVLFDIISDALRGGFIEGHKQGGLSALSVMGKEDYVFDEGIDHQVASLLFVKIKKTFGL